MLKLFMQIQFLYYIDIILYTHFDLSRRARATLDHRRVFFLLLLLFDSEKSNKFSTHCMRVHVLFFLFLSLSFSRFGKCSSF